MQHEAQRWGHNAGVKAQHEQVCEHPNTQCPACWSAVAHKARGRGYKARVITLLTEHQAFPCKKEVEPPQCVVPLQDVDGTGIHHARPWKVIY